MQIEKLDHVNVRTTQLDSMIEWYTRILGMRRGDRPDFDFPGAWMYAGDSACVHLVGVDSPGTGSETELKVEHFAFSASGKAEFEARLKAAGQHYQCLTLSDFNITQFNLWDPDGNHIHIDFPADE